MRATVTMRSDEWSCLVYVSDAGRQIIAEGTFGQVLKMLVQRTKAEWPRHIVAFPERSVAPFAYEFAQLEAYLPAPERPRAIQPHASRKA